MAEKKFKAANSPWLKRLHEIIFEADTPMGKLFDVVLIWAIILSVAIVFLESMAEVRQSFGSVLIAMEWAFTLLFSLEYALRLMAVKKPLRYAFSFYGLVDLLAILPSYLSLFIPGTRYLLVIRILRLLRIFRIFKLTSYIGEAHVINDALKASSKKILVFLLTIISLVIILGSLMYVIEGEKNGFSDIPTSIYWAIVTITTVGYGDISPHTALGKFLAAAVMIIGYAVIAVPTGIITAEFARAPKIISKNTKSCSTCSTEEHDDNATFCKICGNKL